MYLRVLFLCYCFLPLLAIGQKKPNIVYIYADDLGYGELGCYGQKKIRTPYLDKMAAEGIRFTQHYTSAPVCAPARAMLMTGLHGGHSFIRGNYELGGFTDSAERGQMALPSSAFTVADLLKREGYATAMIGKWGLGMATTEGNPLKHGFDYYYGYLDQKQAHNYYPSHLWENDRWDTLRQSFFMVHQKIDSTSATKADFDAFKGKDYAPQKITEKAIRFIASNKDRPFFLYLPYTLPHLALQVPDEWVERYRGQFNEKPYYGQKGYCPHLYPLSAYAAMISYLDAQVGIVLEKLKEVGVDENTIVFFSSDNGASFTGGADALFFNSAAGLRGLKMDLYEGGIRVPLIVRWPGKIRAGGISHHVSVQYDFFETVKEISKSNYKGQSDGISFLPELLGKREKQRKHSFIYFEYPEKGGQLAVRMGNWKAVKTDLHKSPNVKWQLYNLAIDPGETKDLAGQYPGLLKKLDVIVRSQHNDPVIAEWDVVR
jgi:arylsulfatase A-like enzyme